MMPSRNSRPRLTLVLVLTLCLALAIAPRNATAAARYVCPPCNLPCDTTRFDHPGVCPQCGMQLVDASTLASAPPAPARTRVAILLFNGVEIIDSMGPYEVFGAADCDVYTVGATTDPVASAMRQTLVPKYSFADAPQPDVLVVPGGGVRGAMNDGPTLAWIRAVNAHTKHTMSVCNGAFILASAGLLDGLDATTTAHNIGPMRTQFPKVHVVDDQRVVDNGHIITTGGLSAGIDGALHVVERLHGVGEAQQVALGEEYDWNRSGSFARAALADLLIPQAPIDSIGAWTVVRTEGDREHWDLVIRGTSKLTAQALLDQLGGYFLTRGHWTRATTAAAAPRGRTTSAWQFAGRQGEPWTGTLTVEPQPQDDHAFTVSLTIARRS